MTRRKERTMEDILSRVNAVIQALNLVTVCGKQNLANLSGSISVLEDVRDQLTREYEAKRGEG